METLCMALDATAITAADLVADVGGLISLPEVYLRISQQMDNPRSSAADIAEAVSQDPSFTVRLLQVANSALYSFPSTISSVAKAVTLVGTAQVRNLALSMSVAKSFSGLPNELVSMQDFWRHSLLCALIARLLAKQAGRCDPDALFTAGLLHDIGQLIIFNRLPRQAEQALLKVLDSQDQLPVYQAEQEVLGFDHSDVGGELARQWQLPALLEECIACHHRPAAAERHRREVALVYLANMLALLAELDSLDLEDIAPIDPLVWELSGLDASCIEEVVREAQRLIVEIEQLYVGN